MYRKSRLVNVLTPAFRERLIEKGVPPEKIIFIPNAADFAISDQLLHSDFDRTDFLRKHNLTGKKVITYVVYIEPENPEDFADKIEIYLRRSPEELEKEGESGYRFAKAQFDRDVLASEYIQHLSKVSK